MKSKIFIFTVILVLALSFIHLNKASATSLNETETINLLTTHPETLILDIRWQQIYEQYHLIGAILIDNSNPSRDHLQAAQVALSEANQRTNYNKSYPILLICNCPTNEEPEITPGSNTYASYADTYLTGQGYTNVHHLFGSFSDWTDTSWLVSGPSPQGNGVVTSIPPPITSGGGGDPTLIILFLGLAGVLGFGFIIYSASKPPSSHKLKTNLEKTQQKQKQELSKLKSALKTDDNKDSIATKKRQTRRR